MLLSTLHFILHFKLSSRTVVRIFLSGSFHFTFWRSSHHFNVLNVQHVKRATSKTAQKQQNHVFFMYQHRKSYTAEFKLRAVSFAEKNGNRAAGNFFNVDESMVRRWRKMSHGLSATKRNRRAFRIKKPYWPDLEESIKEWVLQQRTLQHQVTTVSIRLQAKRISKEMGILDFIGDGPEHSVGNNDGESESKGHIILYVIVVGFHHKHGSQIEYCFPPIAGSIQGEDLEKCFPVQWQEIPSLAIPDGAHNVDSDVVYFVLPSLEVRNRAVYGISCYRQIPVDDEFREKDETLTRSTVQKSVCVLSTVPLYGVLKSKLQLITQAYFNEKDFSKVEVLNQMYNNLCDLFNDDYLDVHTIYSGISLLPLLKTFKHRALVLFKLLLLEKKIIFNVFPVANLGDILIGLISLFPGLLDKGLSESASYSALNVNSKRNFTINSNVNNLSEKTRNNMPDKIGISQQTLSFSTQNTAIKDGHGQKSSSRNPSSFETDDYGFPLSIFTKGSIFHPYLNINSIDMLRSDSVRAFCVGVTNSIFLQRRELLDVIVTMNEKGDGQVDILSQELKRQLALTKQDLRFMDFLLKMIELNDATLWEGSDDWVRSQFYNYLVAMLAAASAAEKSLISARKLANNLDNKESANPTSMEVGELGGNYAQEFNAEFITTLHSKHNYRVWSCGTHPKFAEASPRHPFAGQSSVNDVLLRVNHAMNDSEQGRRVLSAFSSTGRLVAETKSRLRSSIASWWGRDNENNTNTADDQQSIDAAVEATEEIRLDVINEKK